jgi:hypothetical protein
MIYVFATWRRWDHEKDVPTQQQQAKKNTRFQGADVGQGRPAGAEAPTR